MPADSDKYAFWLNRLKPSLKEETGPFVRDALERRTGPVVLEDRTTVEVIRWLDEWFVHVVTASGFIDLRGTTKAVEFLDATRRVNNVHLMLYPCGKQRGKPDLAQLDQLHSAGRYMEAIIELRKDCDDPNGRKWLETKASEGYAPFQIEYADQLRRSGDEKAIYLYLLGSMRLSEDAAICEDLLHKRTRLASGLNTRSLRPP